MTEADDLRQFIREINTRSDKRTEAIIRRLDAQAEAMRRQAEAMREQASAMREQAAETRDGRAQIRANTEGLLRVLDELSGPA
jgi:uncharacterized coiled-coil DUF342 family protein